ncbi:alpha/beta fold hydrolase [Microbacter sp. GSS18]|nr:alpha/beta fold hydrolase [Microbacter sp. GSS18]
MTAPSIALSAPVGYADAPLLVLGPSLGTSTVLWDTVVPRLAERHRVVAWDLPGHGAAPPASGPFTIGEIADAVADALRTHEHEHFRYAGVSFSGAVGLELMLRHPGMVDGAALLCTAARFGEPEGWHERAAEVRASGTSALTVGSAQRWFAPGSMAREPELTARLLQALQDTDDESYALCCEALAGYDVRDRLGEIETPVLALWGEFDEVTPEPALVEIAEGVQEGAVAWIADAAHLPPVEQPAAVAKVLGEFFAGIDERVSA